MSFFLYETGNICLCISEKQNMQNLLRVNLSYILTNMYNKNQTNNIFYQVSYQILYSSFKEKGIMNKTSSYKLYG